MLTCAQYIDGFMAFQRYEPSPPCNNYGAKSCANEVVYPLITWVLSFDAVLCGLVLLVRAPLTTLGPWGESTNALYYALYGLPLQAVVHLTMGGLVYYVYPYLSIVVSVVVLTIIMTKPADATPPQTLWQILKTETSTLAIFVTNSVFLIFGVAGAGLYTHPKDKWSAFGYVLAPLVPVLLFHAMLQLTEPSLSRRQLMGQRSYF